MIESTVLCRRKVAELAESVGTDPKSQASVLYELAEFLRSKAKVVSMNVPSTANAYVIFEVLNDRGLDLSVLDLVKNHLFGRAGTRLDEAKHSWSQMVGNLGDRPADEFLKVY